MKKISYNDKLMYIFNSPVAYCANFPVVKEPPFNWSEYAGNVRTSVWADSCKHEGALLITSTWLLLYDKEGNCRPQQVAEMRPWGWLLAGCSLLAAGCAQCDGAIALRHAASLRLAGEFVLRAAALIVVINPKCLHDMRLWSVKLSAAVLNPSFARRNNDYERRFHTRWNVWLSTSRKLIFGGFALLCIQLGLAIPNSNCFKDDRSN